MHSTGRDGPNVSWHQVLFSRTTRRGRIELDEAHVALVPGNDFGFPDHVRLSFATSMEQIDKGVDRLEKLLTV